MFKLVKFCLFVVVAVAVGYALLGVSLGQKTLYGHLKSIFSTQEAETLKNEIGKKVDHATGELKDKASALARDRLKEKLDEPNEKKNADSPAEKGPSETEADRKSLNRLISQKNHPDEASDDRAGLNRLIDEKIKENR